VRQFGGVCQVADNDAGNCRRVYYIPFFNETYMGFRVLKIEQGFSQVGDYRVAQRGYADGAEIADKNYRPDFAAAVFSVHGGGYYSTQYHVAWMQDVKNGIGNLGNLGQYVTEDYYNHDNNPANSSGKSVGNMVGEFFSYLSEHFLFLSSSLLAGLAKPDKLEQVIIYFESGLSGERSLHIPEFAIGEADHCTAI